MAMCLIKEADLPHSFQKQFEPLGGCTGPSRMWKAIWHLLCSFTSSVHEPPPLEV